MEPCDYLKLFGDPPIEWTWSDFAGYKETMEKVSKPHNVAALVTHGAIRAKVLSLGNVATPEQIRNGAFTACYGAGLWSVLWSGLSAWQFAPPEELLALGRLWLSMTVIMVHS